MTDISSLPWSDSESQTNIIIPYGKYDEKLPHGLSAVDDIRSNESNETNENLGDKNLNYQDEVKDLIININNTKSKKVSDIWKEICSVAQNLKISSPSSHNAEYISSWAVQIMKMVTSPNGNNDKSLDTLMLEHEEKEIQSKIMAFGQSFISESEHMLDSDHLHTSYANEDQEIEESIVVKGNINSNSNLKNLRKQFAWNQLVHITSRDEDSNRRMDIKTTAATTNRNHNLDEQTVNIKAGNKA